MVSSVKQNVFHCSTPLSCAVLEEVAGQIGAEHSLIWIKPGITIDNCSGALGLAVSKLGSPQSVMLIHEGKPMQAANLNGWRKFLLREYRCVVGCIFLTGNETAAEAIALLQGRFRSALLGTAEKEPPEISVGDWVTASSREEPSSEVPILLTMFFDSLGEHLTEMDGIKRRFQQVVSRDQITRSAPKDLLKKILDGDEAIAKAATQSWNENMRAFRMQRDLVPRVLLLGETGVGKTLFANYLGEAGETATRVSIPEFIDKEDMFEYALFGYCKGAYTDAREAGHAGLLLANIGRVLFLDEIGAATPAIQAKLLAYLDDFMVRPRGATQAIFCPVLIVAATNEDVRQGTSYRNDLLQRFTDHLEIPPLRALKHNFHFIVDAMLQNPGINAEGKIREVGRRAFGELAGREYRTGNFRELGNVLRQACKRAAAAGRDYIVAEDIPT